MCKYYKKLFTCGHYSSVYVERCRIACLPDATSCTTDEGTGHDPAAFQEDLRRAARKSHFPCYDCLIAEAHEEMRAKVDTETDPTKRAALEDSRTRLAGKQAKAEANRRAAEESMRKEREEDEKKKAELAKEKENALKGEGAWVVSGSQRKKKGRGRANGLGLGNGTARKGFGSIMPPKSAPPAVTTFMGAMGGVGGRAEKTGELKKDEPKSANEAEHGRLGQWPRLNGTK